MTAPGGSRAHVDPGGPGILAHGDGADRRRRARQCYRGPELLAADAGRIDEPGLLAPALARPCVHVGRPDAREHTRGADHRRPARYRHRRAEPGVVPAARESEACLPAPGRPGANVHVGHAYVVVSITGTDQHRLARYRYWAAEIVQGSPDGVGQLRLLVPGLPGAHIDIGRASDIVHPRGADYSCGARERYRATEGVLDASRGVGKRCLLVPRLP